MLFNWIAEELGARAAPAPAPHAPHARAARLLRKSVFRVTDCRAPRRTRSPPRRLPLPVPPARSPAQTEPEDTQKDTTSPPKRHASTDTQRRDSGRNGSRRITQVSLWRIKNAETEETRWITEVPKCRRPTLQREHITSPWNGSYQVTLPHTGTRPY